MMSFFRKRPGRRRFALLGVLCVLPVLTIPGCSSLAYYRQAVAGQWEIWQKSQPIEDVIQQSAPDSELVRRLRLVQEIRTYASQKLDLPGMEFYSEYADLQRPFVVWNLFAAPELSLDAKQWCYPLLGCMAYRGYFSPDAAQQAAAELQAEGLETYVGGIIAYSTLGWFDDPVLNTFWLLDDAELAALLFHELAHHRVFILGDTTFNESFATAVELYATERWLHSRYDSREVQRLSRQFDHRQAFVREVRDVTQQLREVYASPLDDAHKRQRKQALFNELQQRYQRLRQSWGEDPGYDAWFRTPLNNAKLITLTSYYDLVPAFLKRIEQLNGDLSAFYRWAQEVGDKPEAERQHILQTLAPAADS